MKKVLIATLFLFGGFLTFRVAAQNEKYQLYKTENMWTFLKLDTGIDLASTI